MATALSYEELCHLLSGIEVSRETYDRLAAFHHILLKWQKKINLISDKEVEDVWIRHILDSIQLSRHLDKNFSIIDLGSGAGFPGLMLSIMGYDITVVESDQKKCSFLSEASLVTGSNPIILNQRIESLHHNKYDVIISRACASLDKLLQMSSPLMDKKSFCLFLKGKNHGEEIEVAKKNFLFDIKILPSITESSSAILKISHIRST
jgi:16S rRNA (guanine527-N7)-methyltransferase